MTSLISTYNHKMYCCTTEGKSARSDCDFDLSLFHVFSEAKFMYSSDMSIDLRIQIRIHPSHHSDKRDAPFRMS